MPVRIYDIAKKLGIESKEVLAKAKELGITGAKVPSSSLDKITAEYLEEQLGGKPVAVAESPSAPAPERVVILSAPPEPVAPVEPGAAPPAPAAELAPAGTELAAAPTPAPAAEAKADFAEPTAPPTPPQPMMPPLPPAPRIGEKVGFIQLPQKPAPKGGPVKLPPKPAEPVKPARSDRPAFAQTPPKAPV